MNTADRLPCIEGSGTSIPNNFPLVFKSLDEMKLSEPEKVYEEYSKLFQYKTGLETFLGSLQIQNICLTQELQRERIAHDATRAQVVDLLEMKKVFEQSIRNTNELSDQLQTLNGTISELKAENARMQDEYHVEIEKLKSENRFEMEAMRADNSSLRDQLHSLNDKVKFLTDDVIPMLQKRLEAK
jgi:low affinity Fe/Cu permease